MGHQINFTLISDLRYIGEERRVKNPIVSTLGDSSLFAPFTLRSKNVLKILLFQGKALLLHPIWKNEVCRNNSVGRVAHS